MFREVRLAALMGVGGMLAFLPGCTTPTTGHLLNPSGYFREIGYEDAVRLSMNERKPMLLLFSDDWTKDRERFADRVFANDATAQLLLEHTVGLQVGINDLSDIAKKHGVATTPVIILVGPDGREWMRWKNPPRAESFSRDVNGLLEPANTGRHLAGAPREGLPEATVRDSARF